MRAQQSFVRGDNSFPFFQRGKNHCPCNAGSADEFDDDLDMRIIDDVLPIERHQRFWDFVRTRFIKGFDGDSAESHFDAEARLHERAIGLERVKNAAAHRATANHSDIDFSHEAQRVPRFGESDNYFLCMEGIDYEFH